MKKKWALLLAAVMALQPLSALTVNAAATVEDVYADVYGIEVDFSEEPAAADLENLELLKGESEEPITVDWESAESGSTKRTINVALDTNTKYKLSFGTTEKTFQVKTLFDENFDDATKFADQNVSDAEASEFENAYGTFEVNYGTYGAFIKDGRVWVTDGAFSITALDTNLDYKNTTFTADIQGYGKNYLARNRYTPPSHTAVNIHMVSRTDTNSEKANGVGIKIANAKHYAGTTNSAGGFVAGDPTTGFTYTDSETFEFGNFENIPSDSSIAAENSGLKVNKDRELNPGAPSGERTISVRANGEQVKGFTQEATGSTAVTDTEAGGFSIFATDTGSGVASIDNVKITTYTEKFAPAISGTLSVENITYDYDGIVLSFNESIEEVGPLSRGKIEVYQDSATEPMTLTSSEIDTEDSTKLVIVPDGYTADHEYEVVVPTDFGTPTLKTDAEWRESFDLVSTPITVTAEFALEGILLTFDTDLTDIAQADDLDSVALEIDGAAVAVADRTITKDGQTLLIVPNNAADYAVGKTYKVTIPQGFGTPNIYLKSEYVFNETFTAIPLEMTGFTGNKGFIEIEFSEAVPATANVSGIVIRDTETDALVTSTPSIAGGKLRVDIPSMVRDKVYEIYIPQGFGTDAMTTTKSILKKFVQKTIAYENFENNGESFGFNSVLSTQGIVTDPLDPNNKIAVIGSTQTIGVDKVQLLDNYTFEYDLRLFYSIGHTRTNNTTTRESTYDVSTITFNSLRFNKADDNHYINLSFKEGGIQYFEKNASTTTQAVNLSFTKTVHGDMYKSSSGFVTYNLGEAFPESVIVKKSDGTRALTCERAPLPATKYELVKTGKRFTLYRDNALLMDKTAAQHTGTKGQIQYYVQGYSYEVWDNVRISAMTLVDEEQVKATELALDGFTGTLEEQSTLSGTFNLKNYTDGDKPVRAVVVAYGEDNEMLCANMLSLTQVAAGEAERGLTFDLDNCTGTKSVKLFLWDDLAHKTKIENYDFPTS